MTNFSHFLRFYADGRWVWRRTIAQWSTTTGATPSTFAKPCSPCWKPVCSARLNLLLACLCHELLIILYNTVGKMERFMVDLEVLGLLVACLCHDLDHRGTNNAYQTKVSKYTMKNNTSLTWLFLFAYISKTSWKHFVRVFLCVCVHETAHIYT